MRRCPQPERNQMARSSPFPQCKTRKGEEMCLGGLPAHARVRTAVVTRTCPSVQVQKITRQKAGTRTLWSPQELYSGSMGFEKNHYIAPGNDAPGSGVVASGKRSLSMAARRGWRTIQLYVTTCFTFSWPNCYASPGYDKLMGRLVNRVNDGKDP